MGEGVYAELIIPTFIPPRCGFNGWFILNALYPSPAEICTDTNWNTFCDYKLGFIQLPGVSGHVTRFYERIMSREETALEWKLNNNKLNSQVALLGSCSFMFAQVGNC